jgi:hypothetical protein
LSRQPTRFMSLISSHIFFFNANHEHRLLEPTQCSSWIPSSMEFSNFSQFGFGGWGGLHSHLEEENQNHFEQGEHV